MKRSSFHFLGQALVFVFILAGLGYLALSAKRADIPTSQNRMEALAGALDHDHPLGQTFSSTLPNLTAIKLEMVVFGKTGNDAAVVNVSLKGSPSETSTIAVHKVPLRACQGNCEINFSFTPQSDSSGKAYYLSISTDADPNRVSFWSSQTDGYPGGDLYRDGGRVSQDIAFWTYASPDWRPATGKPGQTLEQALFFLLVTGFYLIVGLGFILLAGEAHGNDFIELSARAIGIGVALTVLCSRLLAFLRIPMPGWILYAILLVLASGLTIHLSYRASRARRERRGRQVLSSLFARSTGPESSAAVRGTFSQASLLNLSMGLFFCIALVNRASQVKDLSVPNWIDGLIHVELLGKMAQSIGVVNTITYHTGFHLDTYFLSRLSGMQLPELTLLNGQWLNLACGLSFYVLAKRCFRNSHLAVLSCSIYWFLAPFPSYLISWSRFPLLLGLYFIPLVVVLGLECFRQGKNTASFCILAAGLLLSHYGSFVIALSFFGGLGLYLLWIKRKTGVTPQARRLAIKTLLLAIALAAAAVLLIVPLLKNGQWVEVMNQVREDAAEVDLLNLLKITFSHGGFMLWGLGLSGCLVAVFCHRKVFFFTIGWCLALAVVLGLQAALLGVSVPSLADAIIFLSLPLALLSAVSCQFVFAKTQAAMADSLAGNGGALRPARLGAFLYLVFAIVIGLVGAYNLTGIVNPATVLYTPADQQAMLWIENNTPADSLFLVNSSRWGDAYQPSDGGGWIPAITGRRIQVANTAAEFANIRRLIELRGIGYIYLGPGASEFDPAQFTQDTARYTLLYEYQGRRIFRVNT